LGSQCKPLAYLGLLQARRADDATVTPPASSQAKCRQNRGGGVFAATMRLVSPKASIGRRRDVTVVAEGV